MKVKLYTICVPLSMLLKFIHVVPCVNILLLFIAE